MNSFKTFFYGAGKFSVSNTSIIGDALGNSGVSYAHAILTTKIIDLHPKAKRIEIVYNSVKPVCAFGQTYSANEPRFEPDNITHVKAVGKATMHLIDLDTNPYLQLSAPHVSWWGGTEPTYYSITSIKIIG